MLPIESFLTSPGMILDVRSPGEYLQAHIPGAKNLPLFTNEERAQVGTLYKKEGKEKAIELGLKIVGPKLFSLVKEAKKLILSQPAKIHCWRGGMRSSSVQWLLNTANIPSISLKGGYKQFRHWTLEQLQKPRHIVIIGGFTGSGKTQVLQSLKASGEQVLDLEKLACHKGSSFGMICQKPQPTNEQFENEIAFQLFSSDPDQILWIEDESKLIGRCKIPDFLYQSMRNATVIKLNRTKEERITLLLQEYSSYPLDQLISATERLVKRLGSQRTNEIIQCIKNNNLISAISSLLHYYDQTYTFGLSKRNHSIIPIDVSSLSPSQIAKIIKKIII